jgi:hypothetical protein
MSGTLPIKISNDIISEINNFINEGNIDKELEIIISSTKMTVDEYLDEITFTDFSKLTLDCTICKLKIKTNQSIRIFKNCNHHFHKKCFDKLFKQKIILNNVVNELTNYCTNCI